MNIKEINSKKLFKEFEIQIPYIEVDDLINKKIMELMPTVSLPGFRKGKAPLNILKKKYENNVISEVLEKIVDEKTKKLLDEKKIKAFRPPKVEIKSYEKNSPLELLVKVDIEPIIKIASFEEIEINKMEIVLDKKTIDGNYTNFIESQKHYHKITENRSLLLSDKVMLNISTVDTNVPEFLKSQNNLPVVTNAEYQILPDISSRLIKKKVKAGDKINLIFDIKDILKSKVKKEVEFNIEILSIEHAHEFKVTEDFLKKNNLKNEEDLKKNLQNNLEKQYDDFLKQIQTKELMDILDDSNIFDVPEGILEEEFQSIWKKLEMAKKDDKLDEDDKGLSDDELKKRYNKIALRRVKLAILMQKIATNNKIIVSEKELTDGMLQYASQYPGQEKEIFEYFKKNPSSVDSIRGPIFEQKIIDHILSKVKLKVKKVNIKDFEKLQDNAFKNKDI